MVGETERELVIIKLQITPEVNEKNSLRLSQEGKDPGTIARIKSRSKTGQRHHEDQGVLAGEYGKQCTQRLETRFFFGVEKREGENRGK